MKPAGRPPMMIRMAREIQLPNPPDGRGIQAFAHGSLAISAASAAPDPAKINVPGSIQRNRMPIPCCPRLADAIAEDPAMLRLAGKLISKASTGSDLRFERIAALRQAIKSGTYSVSSEQLAEKLIEKMRG
jgi:hypothetical protein